MEDDIENWLIEEIDDDFCPTCNGTGRVVAADGYHEYLGYDYLACPDCDLGASRGYPTGEPGRLI